MEARDEKILEILERYTQCSICYARFIKSKGTEFNLSKLVLARSSPIAVEVGQYVLPIYVKRCLHRFCKACFDRSISVQKVKTSKLDKCCPLCRTSISSRRDAREDTIMAQLVAVTKEWRADKSEDEEADLQETLRAAIAQRAQQEAALLATLRPHTATAPLPTSCPPTSNPPASSLTALPHVIQCAPRSAPTHYTESLQPHVVASQAPKGPPGRVEVPAKLPTNADVGNGLMTSTCFDILPSRTVSSLPSAAAGLDTCPDPLEDDQGVPTALGSQLWHAFTTDTDHSARKSAPACGATAGVKGGVDSTDQPLGQSQLASSTENVGLRGGSRAQRRDAGHEDTPRAVVCVPASTPNLVPAGTPSHVPADAPNDVPAGTPNDVPAATPKDVPAATRNGPPQRGQRWTGSPRRLGRMSVYATRPPALTSPKLRSSAASLVSPMKVTHPTGLLPSTPSPRGLRERAGGVATTSALRQVALGGGAWEAAVRGPPRVVRTRSVGALEATWDGDGGVSKAGRLGVSRVGAESRERGSGKKAEAAKEGLRFSTELSPVLDASMSDGQVSWQYADVTHPPPHSPRIRSSQRGNANFSPSKRKTEEAGLAPDATTPPNGSRQRSSGSGGRFPPMCTAAAAHGGLEHRTRTRSSSRLRNLAACPSDVDTASDPDASIRSCKSARLGALEPEGKLTLACPNNASKKGPFYEEPPLQPWGSVGRLGAAPEQLPGSSVDAMLARVGRGLVPDTLRGGSRPGSHVALTMDNVPACDISVSSHGGTGSPDASMEVSRGSTPTHRVRTRQQVRSARHACGYINVPGQYPMTGSQPASGPSTCCEDPDSSRVGPGTGVDGTPPAPRGIVTRGAEPATTDGGAIAGQGGAALLDGQTQDKCRQQLRSSYPGVRDSRVLLPSSPGGSNPSMEAAQKLRSLINATEAVTDSKWKDVQVPSGVGTGLPESGDVEMEGDTGRPITGHCELPQASDRVLRAGSRVDQLTKRVGEMCVQDSPAFVNLLVFGNPQGSIDATGAARRGGSQESDFLTVSAKEAPTSQKQPSEPVCDSSCVPAEPESGVYQHTSYVSQGGRVVRVAKGLSARAVERAVKAMGQGEGGQVEWLSGTDRLGCIARNVAMGDLVQPGKVLALRAVAAFEPGGQNGGEQ